MLLLFPIRERNDYLFGKELFIRFTVRVFRETFIKLCLCPSFPFGFKGGMWYLILLIPDHCLSIYFLQTNQMQNHDLTLTGIVKI